MTESQENYIPGYTKAVETMLRDALGSVSYDCLNEDKKLFAFHFYKDKEHLVFVLKMITINQSDINPGSLAKEVRDALAVFYDDNTPVLVDIRTVLIDDAEEQSRFIEMANLIVKTFQTRTIISQSVTLDMFKDQDIIVDWSLARAKELESSWSPTGILPRMEIALTLLLKHSNQYGVEYTPIGVIGGYTDFLEKSPHRKGEHEVLLYQPVFNITYCENVFLSKGMNCLLLGVLAPVIYGTQFWVQQWKGNLGQEGKPQPGLLEGIDLTDAGDLLEFIKTHMSVPQIVYHRQVGRDPLEGIFGNPEYNGSDQVQLFRFFLQEQVPIPFDLFRDFKEQIDGISFEEGGLRQDSRLIDYLKLASTNGVKAVERYRGDFLGSLADQYRREIIDRSPGNHVWLFLNKIKLINPDFVKWIVDSIQASNITIVDPCLPKDSSTEDIKKTDTFGEGFGKSFRQTPPAENTFFDYANNNRGMTADYYLNEIAIEIARVKDWLNDRGFDSFTSVNYIARQYRTELKKLYRKIESDMID